MPENELLKALRNIQNPPKPKPAQKPGSTGVPAIDKQVAIRAERERKQLAKVEKTNTVTYRRQVGTSPIKAGAGYKPGEVRQRTAEAEMADYDRRVFGIVTSGDFSQLTPEVIKRLGGVKRAKQMFAERNNYRDTKAIPMIAEINRRNEAYTSGGLTQEELDQAFESSDPTLLERGMGALRGTPLVGAAAAAYAGATGQKRVDNAPVSRFIAEGQPGVATDNPLQQFGRAVSTVLNQPASVTRAGLTGDARQTRDLGLWGGIEELVNFGAGMMAGGSLGTIGAGTKVAQAAKLLSRALVTDAPGYAVMIKDSGGIGQAAKSMAESVGYGFSKDASPADTVNSVAMTLALLGGAYHMGGKTLTGAKNALKARLPKEAHPKIEAAAKVVEAPVNEQEAMMRELLGEEGAKEFARAKIERWQALPARPQPLALPARPQPLALPARPQPLALPARPQPLALGGRTQVEAAPKPKAAEPAQPVAKPAPTPVAEPKAPKAPKVAEAAAVSATKAENVTKVEMDAPRKANSTTRPTNKLPKSIKFRHYGTVTVDGDIAYKVGVHDNATRDKLVKNGYQMVGNGSSYLYYSRGEAVKVRDFNKAKTQARYADVTEQPDGNLRVTLFREDGQPIYSTVREPLEGGAMTTVTRLKEIIHNTTLNGSDPFTKAAQKPDVASVTKADAGVTAPEASPVAAIREAHVVPTKAKRVPLPEAWAKEKVSKTTGLRKSQVQFLGDEINKGIDQLPGKMDGDTKRKFLGSDSFNPDGLEIAVPGDGTWKIFDKEQASKLKKAIGYEEPNAPAKRKVVGIHKGVGDDPSVMGDVVKGYLYTHPDDTDIQFVIHKAGGGFQATEPRTGFKASTWKATKEGVESQLAGLNPSKVWEVITKAGATKETPYRYATKQTRTALKLKKAGVEKTTRTSADVTASNVTAPEAVKKTPVKQAEAADGLAGWEATTHPNIVKTLRLRVESGDIEGLVSSLKSFNPLSRKGFELMTGVKLPATDKGTAAAIRDWGAEKFQNRAAIEPETPKARKLTGAELAKAGREARSNKTLDTTGATWTTDDGAKRVGSLRKYVKSRVADGYRPESFEEVNYRKVNEAKEYISENTLRDGTPKNRDVARLVEEAREVVASPPVVTKYRLKKDGDSGYPATKVEIDYAAKLLESGPVVDPLNSNPGPRDVVNASVAEKAATADVPRTQSPTRAVADVSSTTLEWQSKTGRLTTGTLAEFADEMIPDGGVLSKEPNQNPRPGNAGKYNYRFTETGQSDSIILSKPQFDFLSQRQADLEKSSATRTTADVTADIKESLSTLKDLKKSGKLLKDPTRKGGKQSGGLYIPQLTPEGREQVIHLAKLVLERTKMAKDEFVDKFSVMIGNTGPRDFVRGVASEAYDAVTAKPVSTVAQEPKTPQKPVQAPQTAKASVVNPPEPSDGKPVFQSAQDPSDRLRSELGWAPVSRGGRPLADVLASPVVKDIAERGGEFAREWQESPRSLTAEETAGLGAAVIDTRIALRDAEIKHQAMTTAGKMGEAERVAVEIDKLSEDLANLTYVVSKSGSEWGMAGLARQMELRRGNDRSGLQYRLRRAKRGQKPSASEVRVAEQIGKKFEDIEAEIQRRVDKIIADRFDLPRRVGRTSGARFPGVKKTVFTDEMFKAAITKGCK
jgi:hypothetical protein